MSTAELLAAKRPTPDSWWSWARVDSLAPLRVVLDGEAVALAITPEDHVGGLAVGNRVRMHFHYGRAYVTSKAGGPVPASNPNLVINGRGAINQRGYVSGTSLSAGQYCLDRFKANDAGTTVTFTADVHGQPMTANAGKYVVNTIEPANLAEGINTYTISWEGNATVGVYGTYGLTSPLTIDVNGIYPFGLAIGNGTFDKLKMEYGVDATPFQESNYGDELRRCQRYYVRSVGTHYSPCTNSGFPSSYAMAVALSPKMRTTPTLTVYSGADQAGTAGSATWFASGAGTVAPAFQEQVSADHFSIMRQGVNSPGMVLFSFTVEAEL